MKKLLILLLLLITGIFPNEKMLLLKNKSTEYIINPGDPILIKRKQDHLGGNYVNIGKNYLLINTSTGKKNKLEKVFLNNIHIIYTGNIKSYATLYKKWRNYFAILMIPASIQMKNVNNDMLPKGVTAIVNWTLFNAMCGVTYTPLFSYIDFINRKSNAREFIIDLNNWEIITK
tara:strand:+ start:187 stop:708 length:522 start_codon:yes stop_codon:yes gene_type:complete